MLYMRGNRECHICEGIGYVIYAREQGMLYMRGNRVCHICVGIGYVIYARE